MTSTAETNLPSRRAAEQVQVDKSVFHKYIMADSKTKESIDKLLPDLLTKTIVEFIQKETVESFKQELITFRHFAETGFLDRYPDLDAPLFKLFRRVDPDDFTKMKTFFSENPQLMSEYLEPFARVLNLPPPERAQLIDVLRTSNTPLRFDENERYEIGELLQNYVSIRNAQEAGLVGASRVHPSRIPEIESILPFNFDKSASKLPLLYDNTTPDAFLPRSKIESCLQIDKKKRRTVGFADDVIYIAHNTFPAEIECQLISLYGKHNKPNTIRFTHSTSVNKTYKPSAFYEIQKYITYMKPSIRRIAFDLTDYGGRFKRHMDDMQIVRALHDNNKQRIFHFYTAGVVSDAFKLEFASILKDLNAATKSDTFAFAKARSPNTFQYPEFVYTFHGHLPPLEFFQQSFDYEQRNAQDQIVATQPRHNISIVVSTSCFNQYFVPREEKTLERIRDMLIAMHNNQEVRDTVGRLLSLLRNEKTSFVIGFANLPFMSNKDYLPPISMLQGYMVQHMKRMEVPCLIEVVHFQKVPHIILQRT